MNCLLQPVVNALWLASCRRSFEKFRQNSLRLRRTQEEHLHELLKKNTNTLFGKNGSFSSIQSVDSYRSQVPLSRYEDYSPYLSEIGKGKKGILTEEEVLLFEPTSGSSSDSKLIPYTHSLKREFHHAINPWVYSLHKQFPELKGGSSYWSLSPSMHKESTSGVVKIGFDSDSEYLGLCGKIAHGIVSSVPSSVARIQCIDEFRLTTLAYLLADKNLRLISVWSPTFLTVLIDYFMRHREKVLSRMSGIGLYGINKRVLEIDRLLSETSDLPLFQLIWPHLKVISCWTDGASKEYALDLHKFFPNVHMQGKGLVATEAITSIPFLPDKSPALAINSHFFEFKEMDSDKTWLADELKVGASYNLVVTTAGGLYRYISDDIVRISGYYNQIPLMDFMGKDNGVSDLTGEKLNPIQVGNVMALIRDKFSIMPSFSLLAPLKSSGSPPRYCLFLEGVELSATCISKLLLTLDSELSDNYHYQYSRRTGQLAAPCFFQIDSASGQAHESYQNRMISLGVKAGDVKPSVLSSEEGWEKCFHGHMLASEGEEDLLCHEN
ncbi:MAG: GH3 auxin-responsive promoter family protein [Planctomycetes bacterium]|nr:GH3 auxin-responsive promoter family protein [Planctomycetota bacterium]